MLESKNIAIVFKKQQIHSRLTFSRGIQNFCNLALSLLLTNNNGHPILKSSNEIKKGKEILNFFKIIVENVTSGIPQAM